MLFIHKIAALTALALLAAAPLSAQTPSENGQATTPQPMQQPMQQQPMQQPMSPPPTQAVPVTPVPVDADASDSHAWVPWVLGALVLLAALAWFLNRRGKTGQVIAANDEKRP